ncbi:type II toxin-antitoxin system VapC family toxin [Tianweitania populi]|uniref:DNA-binding protein n=1 Tax=Tianweitania populi TaxID=1607949 RepID=A0A8J3GL96_9HYPH|nr:type II toxin-antitoxin system VapC family toxin [Tianweitania populi]GHD16371.1 DNA-binding protein [Tianweitania populi]
MSDTLVDTNVLLDLVTDSPQFEWSNRQLDEAILRGRPVINDVIYAELSVGYREIGEIDEFLRETGIDIVAISKPALFLAGKAFQTYRKRGGTRTGVLPDFFIGAHAQVEGLPLLTRDPRHYRTYFPDVELIAP